MENNLLRVVKLRLMEELRYVIQTNQVYRDKVEVYHKFPYKERPSMGVVLRNASSSRIKLSADDAAGTLKSHLALARAENREAGFLQWVWEDANNLTAIQPEEDLSSQIQGTSSFGTNRFFYTSIKPIISGKNNTIIADNFRQVSLTLNGDRVLAEYVNGEKGLIALSMAPVVGDVLKIAYYYNKLTPPGRYYIEIIDPGHFVIDPFYRVIGETVISNTTGTELTAQLPHGNVYGDFDVLYTMKTRLSNKLYLEKNVDYTITTSGLITFLHALPVGDTLYADYRWGGTTLGPYDLPKEFQYNDTALPGVVLAFSNQFNVGSRMVVIVYPQREPAAAIYSGHYQMSFEIDVLSRDPQQLADLTDYIISGMWSYRRLSLIDEGLTMTEMDPTGESEDVYDTNTGDLYYKNGINLQMMTEWKKFVPYSTEILDFDTKLYAYQKLNQYIVTDQNKVLEIRLLPNTVPFEVKYPKVGYARII